MRNTTSIQVEFHAEWGEGDTYPLRDLGESPGRIELDRHALVHITDFANFDDHTARKLVGLAPLRDARLFLAIRGSVTDRGLSLLARLKRLEHLTVQHCPRITGTGFRAFRQHHHLTTVDLAYDQRLTDAGFEALSDVASVERLILFKLNGFGDRAATSVAAMPRLRWLRLWAMSGLTNVRAGALLGSRTLEHLDLYECPQIDAAALAGYSPGPSLRRVNFLESPGITQSDIPLLEKSWGVRVSVRDS